ncbi:Sec-independent protein translocase protein TatAd [Rosistilla oblonga]|uniref:Sec-independent protein translocase protein TatAd n=1 Tax=Rosistilla oblonga TaxID=2527990 RepID=A0A518INT7_9BACT|nr:twin-arginine translocase TatA/TatE family subunit [Rosistilla oblonga]QDV10919.1 Sec-independent protein translocase protein TatAd [Rosistilla oblonga]QDV54756.1 Sec-independent protein translocase protein TatAd [Rosistilla oblonga]
MTQLLGIGMPGLPEMMIILVILLVLFGGAKLPTLMRNLGRSANEFKHGLNDPVSEDSDKDKPAE